MKNLARILISFFLVMGSASAADIPRLKNLFQKNYNNYYQPRYCGRNIERFTSEALRRNIDLKGAYVLKISGTGFLETSAFYTRNKINDRAMLGYFHMVLVADDYVFDFDLAEPLALKVEDYFRLQFTPPYEPYKIFGVDYTQNKNPHGYKLVAFDYQDYARGDETVLWESVVRDYIDMKALYKRPRLR